MRTIVSLSGLLLFTACLTQEPAEERLFGCRLHNPNDAYSPTGVLLTCSKEGGGVVSQTTQMTRSQFDLLSEASEDTVSGGIEIRLKDGAVTEIRSIE